MSARAVLVVAAASACRAPAPPPAVVWDVTAHDARELDAALAAARARHQPVWIEFTASWCAACRLLDRDTYTAPGVAAAARRFATVQIDASTDTPELAQLARRFAVSALPTLVFASSAGDELAAPRIVGALDPPALLAALATVR